MHQFHYTLRRILPFLYERNWYTGVFEFSTPRALMFFAAVGVCTCGVVLVWWLSGPIEYTQNGTY